MSKNYKNIAFEEKRDRHHFYFIPEKCLYKLSSNAYLQCIEKNCKCSGKIVGDVFARTNNIAHNHTADHSLKATYEKTYSNLREAVRTQETTSIRDLHHQALRADLPREVFAMLSWKKCRKTLERIRYDKMPSCKSLEELKNLLEDEESFVYSRFGEIRGQDFYQGSVGNNMIFANLDLIKELPEKFNMFVDGTFNVTPYCARNHQLLVILGEVQNKPRPLIYVAMQGKSATDYEAVFKYLRDSILSFDGTTREPKQATSDFEKALRNAIKEVWKGIDLIGCYFHYTQALGRNAGSKIKKGKVHKKILWFFKRLALLPIEKVDEGYKEIVRYIRQQGLTDDFKDFLAYFRSTWLVSFPKKVWNVSSVDRRTNNHIEGYNNKIKTVIKLRPSQWKFLDALIDLALDATTDYDADKLTNAPPPKDRSKLTKPLKTSLEQLEAGTITVFGFLQAMSKDFSKPNKSSKQQQ